MSDCPTTIGSPCPFLPAFFGVSPLFGGALLGGGGALLLGPNDARRMAFFALMAFLMGVAIFLDCDMAFLMGVDIVFLAAGFLVAAFLGEPFVLAFRAAGILRRDSRLAKFKSTEGVGKKKRKIFCLFLSAFACSFEVTVTSVSLPPFVSRRGLSNTNQRLSLLFPF